MWIVQNCATTLMLQSSPPLSLTSSSLDVQEAWPWPLGPDTEGKPDIWPLLEAISGFRDGEIDRLYQVLPHTNR